MTTALETLNDTAESKDFVKKILKKNQPTPRNPQKKNPFRKAMKGKSQSTQKKLAKKSLRIARIREVIQWKKKREQKLNSMWR